MKIKSWLAVSAVSLSILVPTYVQAAVCDLSVAENDSGRAPEIFEQCVRAAYTGSRGAQHSVGYMYQYGIGVQRNYIAAINWYRVDAAKGGPASQYNLGYLYYFGYGVPRDFTEAMKWYRMAADQGMALAQEMVGLMYEAGQGVQQSFADPAMWQRKSAEQGSSLAQASLGARYQ